MWKIRKQVMQVQFNLRRTDQTACAVRGCVLETRGICLRFCKFSDSNVWKGVKGNVCVILNMGMAGLLSEWLCVREKKRWTENN